MITLTTQVKLIIAAVLLVAVALGAYLFGVRTTQPVRENIEPVGSQSQPDGSVILARAPAASAPADATPRQTIPKGAKVERVISATIKPRAVLKIPTAGAESAPAATECPPVRIDLSLIREGDQRRIIASSPDGDVVAGLDVPLEAGTIPTTHPWSAGLSYGTDRTPGVYVERDLGRIRVGAEAIRQEAGTVQGRVRLGWNW
jgi:hypothetical protein